MNNEDKQFAIFLALFLLVLLLLVIGLVAPSILAQSGCLHAGYPQSKLDASFRAYCIKRLNQSDIVLPLAEVRK